MLTMRFCLSIIFCYFINHVQAQGIEFLPKETPWSDVLKKATEQNKIIFVDFYTDWCGPCKMMDRKIFPLKDVGTIYNQQFINVKIDAEKGEGPRLQELYNINAYPTFAFLDNTGELLHISIGGKDSMNFIELAKEAIDPQKQYAKMKKRFLNSELNSSELMAFANQSLYQESSLASKAAEQYLETQDNWLTKENINFIAQFLGNVDSKTFLFLIKHKDEFESILGEPYVEWLILSTGSRSIKKQYYDEESKMTNSQEAIKYLSTFIDKELAENITAYTNITADETTPMNISKIKKTEKYLDQYSSKNATFLNHWAWAVYENSDEKALLSKALTWSLLSIKDQDVYMTNDTAAALYFKLGDKANALSYAHRAMDKAKSTGEKTIETEELIKKIEGM